LPPEQNDCRPIGVFDSGVGGLSMLMALRKHLPEESFIYVADSGFAHYGDRSSAFIEDRVSTISDFLISKHVKSIVIACNTATVTAIAAIRAKYSLPIVGMEPAMKPATEITRSGVVGVLATERTIKSQAVADLCECYCSTIRFLLQPCPGLVECVENGDISSDQVRALLTNFIAPLLAKNADTLVLGCTHYVFLKSLIEEIAGPDVTVVESSFAVARQVERRLPTASTFENMLANKTSMPTTVFYTTSENTKSNSLFSVLLKENVEVHSL
jgi:glutamate racemase